MRGEIDMYVSEEEKARTRVRWGANASCWHCCHLQNGVCCFYSGIRDMKDLCGFFSPRGKVFSDTHDRVRARHDALRQLMRENAKR